MLRACTSQVKKKRKKIRKGKIKEIEKIYVLCQTRLLHQKYLNTITKLLFLILEKFHNPIIVPPLQM